MSIGVNELFEMLSWNSDEETQKKGIEEAKNIRYLSIFLQPIERKDVWENCAKILADNDDENLEPYLFSMLEWLQDANWPGFDIIYNRIKAMPVKLLSASYSYSIKEAKKLEDEMWLRYLARLAENKELYNSLSKKEKNIIEKYTNKSIYEDVVNEVKEEYIDLLKQDMFNEEATKRLIKKWKTNDIYEEAIFWIALADVQWEYGRLQEEVKKQALYYLESNRELEKIQKKLNSLMPKEKKIKKYKKYICQWNIGDVYAYQVKENEEYKGKYIVLIKISEKQSWPHNICPIVYVYNKIFEQIPNIEELKDIPYLIQFHSPSDYKGIYEDMTYKSLIYIENSTKKMTKDYIYIGNIKNYSLPNNEETEGDNENVAYYCYIDRFEKTQIGYYNKWKGIDYSHK